MTRAVALTRLEPETIVGREAQRQAIEDWAALHRVQIVEYFDETATGVAPLGDRPVLVRALWCAIRRKVDWFVAHTRADLSANQMTTLIVEDRLRRHLVTITTAAEEETPPPTPEHAIIRETLHAVGQFETALIERHATELRSVLGVRLGAPRRYDGESLIELVDTLRAKYGDWKSSADAYNRILAKETDPRYKNYPRLSWEGLRKAYQRARKRHGDQKL